jgi:hypothetical protein
MRAGAAVPRYISYATATKTMKKIVMIMSLIISATLHGAEAPKLEMIDKSCFPMNISPYLTVESIKQTGYTVTYDYTLEALPKIRDELLTYVRNGGNLLTPDGSLALHPKNFEKKFVAEIKGNADSKKNFALGFTYTYIFRDRWGREITRFSVSKDS